MRVPELRPADLLAALAACTHAARWLPALFTATPRAIELLTSFRLHNCWKRRSAPLQCPLCPLDTLPASLRASRCVGMGHARTVP